MNVFRSIVFSAALSGLLVGLLVTAMQLVGTVPLIAQGEVYEKAEARPDPAPHTHAHGTVDGHHHDVAAPAWEPADGLERNAFTALFNVVERMGFGLVLAGAIVLAGRPFGWREGLLWGMAGFVVFALAPGIGLPPELPGTPVAPLDARQAWWIATAAATAAGLALIAFTRSPWTALAAVILIAAPHAVGAPDLAQGESAVPDGLAHRFVVVVFLTTFLSWAALGALTGYLGRRFMVASA